MASFYSCGYRVNSCGSLEPHLRQNYSIFTRNFKQNQHKLSNNHVQFSNPNILCKFEPTSKKSWIRPCFYHSFYFIYMGQPISDPYGTLLHCPYGCPHGSHIYYKLGRGRLRCYQITAATSEVIPRGRSLGLPGLEPRTPA